MSRNNNLKAVQGIHWIARILSIVSTSVVLLIFIGSPLEISTIAAREWVGLSLFPIGVVFGFAVAWWKEWLGGSITTFSLLGFYLIYGLLLNGRINQGWAFIVFAFPGLLFLLSSMLSRLNRPGPGYADCAFR